VIFLSVLILNLVFLAFISLLYSLLLKFNWIKEYEDVDLIKTYGLQTTLFIACVFAPVVEEMIFRFHLRRRNLNIYFIFSSVSVIIASCFSDELVKWSIYLVFFISAIIFHVGLSKKSVGRSQRLWMKYYSLIFYATSLLFGLVHLSNFEGLTVSDPFFIIYISSQIFAGLGFGYVRIKYGIGYSMLLHSCCNGIILLFHIV